jgi:hypothetical protein
MKINGIDMEDIYTIENNYDNLQVLDVVKYLIGVVLNDVDYMNGDKNYDDLNEFDLGNNYIIKKDDLESLYSILDTITDIQKINNEVID